MSILFPPHLSLADFLLPRVTRWFEGRYSNVFGVVFISERSFATGGLFLPESKCYSFSIVIIRSQSVRIGSVLSTVLPITHGVPQGSILGPILFNIYINDLPTIPRVYDLESFVDDSKLLLSFFIDNAEASSNFITEDLQRVATWCCANSLLMNPDKTKLLLLGTRQMLNEVPQNFHVTLLGKQIFPVSQAKDLGIILDASMTFDAHVTNVVSSCIAGLCQINRAKYIFSKQNLINIVNALIFSKLYYGWQYGQTLLRKM